MSSCDFGILSAVFYAIYVFISALTTFLSYILASNRRKILQLDITKETDFS